MTQPIAPSAAQYLRTDTIRGGMDLLMFAHKSHLARADSALTARGLGRAHHRVLYMVSRRPGQSVTTLLETLGITKQSLGRVLRELTDQGLLEGRTGEHDRRTKLLHLTEEGSMLEHALFEQLHANMARAYAAAGEAAVSGYWCLMQHLMDDTAHGHFLSFNASPRPR
ncbi:MAG: MarR family transcriptional regulator [Sphingomonas sp.]|nr:MAG: MarR family transcriptional regulator [Sphingomonas sp.]